jgi:hypothetical protein
MDKDTTQKDNKDNDLLGSNLVINPLDKRKSQRINKKEYFGNEIQLINCHCCKIVDSALNMITCCRTICRESFCISCVRKHYFKFNTNTFLTLKEYEAVNR